MDLAFVDKTSNPKTEAASSAGLASAAMAAK